MGAGSIGSDRLAATGVSSDHVAGVSVRFDQHRLDRRFGQWNLSGKSAIGRTHCRERFKEFSVSQRSEETGRRSDGRSRRLGRRKRCKQESEWIESRGRAAWLAKQAEKRRLAAKQTVSSCSQNRLR